MEHDHVVMERSEVTGLITIGTNTCCRAHSDELSLEGYTADIDLEEERQEVPPNIAIYLWLPTPDHQAPTPEQLQAGVALIQTLVTQGKRVYVHCKNGHGRSPLLVAAYLVSTGKTVQEAWALVQAKRPEAHLQPVQLEAIQTFAERK